mmetsp:Transcript_1330/g.2515  ORF Transcript_1330/g.2515 Transcript_1330/m.2515 type:complete len:529 (-) Transcript_1330:308-1894(-)|eukprot:CAMPEP_0196660058 /NCGR_PEP_ID=MMETSP1086-20130531/37910_1 /TAXON_ID=77921 /ORGANISM="Cyanoptyche  gloeocystis , Strain SAG4.97" /LENGTH=528 /DNA_ID=CAMNT_0041994295 /DNA_START=93 /DNA_END=1679 /DNA_ORIENTATION=-
MTLGRTPAAGTTAARSPSPLVSGLRPRLLETHPSLRICVLQSSYEGSSSCFKDSDPYADPASLAEFPPSYTFTNVLVKKATAVQQIRDIRDKFDVFINLCDGSFDEDRAGIEVVQALERFHLPFTGASSSFFEPTKEHMKTVAFLSGVPTPAFVFAYDSDGIARADSTLNYPMIVKHYNGYGSVGMSQKSRVNNFEELQEMASEMISNFGGALVEEFIEGREFTVLVAENPDDFTQPFAFQPVESQFPPGESFKHFGLKWIDFHEMTWKPCADLQLAEQLRDFTKRFFVAFGGQGYARCDIRADRSNNIYVLEINPNCGIFYPKDSAGSADNILMQDPAGHRGFILHILECALRRQRRTTIHYEVRFDKKKGYSLYAKSNIAKGTKLDSAETGSKHVLSPTSNVAWNPRANSDSDSAASAPGFQQRFNQFSFPLSPSHALMWVDPYGGYRPVPHHAHVPLSVPATAQEPNVIVIGAELVAIRDITKGEALIIDYSLVRSDQSALSEGTANHKTNHVINHCETPPPVAH